jgi:hypothetical protein
LLDRDFSAAAPNQVLAGESQDLRDHVGDHRVC